MCVIVGQRAQELEGVCVCWEGMRQGEAWVGALGAAPQRSSHPFAWPVSPEQKQWSGSLANPFGFKPESGRFPFVSSRPLPLVEP